MQLSRNMLFVMSLLISLLIIFSAVSRFTQQFDQKAAFNINPLNARARLTYIYSNLANDDVEKKKEKLKEIVEKGLQIDPYDARYYSILGLIAEVENNQEFAQDLYQHTRSLVHTEQYALLRQLAYSFGNKSYSEAAELVELIYLRWKSRWPLIEPLLSSLLSNEEAYQKLQSFFLTTPRGPITIIRSLLKSDKGKSIAKRLLIDWHKRGINDLAPLIARTNTSLIKADKPFEAYQLFYFTLDEGQKEASGYVFNGSFDFEGSKDPFNWSITNQSGVDISLSPPNRKSPEDQSLKIRFLDKPTNLNNMHQTVNLPKNKFVLKIDYTNKNVKGPKPVIVGIQCNKNSSVLGEVELLKANQDQQSRQVEFIVPAVGCDLQKISIYNRNFSKRWTNRYSGEIFIHDISIQLSEG